MKAKHKHFGIILLSVLLAVAFIVFAGIKPGYANILSPKQGINEYHFYDNTKEEVGKNPDSAKEIQKQLIANKGKLSEPRHVFKGKDKVFLKWQDEEGNDIKFDTPIEIKGDEKKVIKVYPVFKKQIVITYFVEGKVFTTDTIDKDDTEYKIPLDPIIYDANRYFVYWTTSKDEKGIGTGNEYNDESLKNDIAAGKTDITLYAKTEFKYKATFITGEGASLQEQILADKDEPLNTVPDDPTRDGYKFSHWSLTKDGDPVDLSTYKLEKDITVYAVWTPIVVDYKFKVMVQNINDDGYTFHEIISARGLNGKKTSLPFKGSENPDPKVAPTGPIVEDIKNLTEKDGRFSNGYNSKDENGKMDHPYTNPQTLDYKGLHLNEEKTKQAFETIKADGSTVVPVYMDRNVHTIWVYKNASGTSYYQANWVNATDENGNIHVDLRYGQSSETWFDKLNKDYIYYMDKSIGSFYTRAPAMGDKDIYMYRVYAKGTKYQLRFVEWDPSKFNASINSSSLSTLQSTLGTMKEIGKRVSFQNSEWYMTWNGYKYRVFEPYNGMWQQNTYSWVDKTDHVDDIKGFQPKTGDMSRDGLQSVNVNNPAFRDYMFAPRGQSGYQNYTGTPYMEDGNYVGFLFYIRKSYNINYYSGNKKITSKSYKYEAPVTDFGIDYKVGKTTNPDNPKQIFKGWYKDSTFSVPYTAEDIKTMPANDTNVYAKWETVEYKVTFHTNQSDYADKQYIEEVTNIPDSKTIYDGKYKDAEASEENLPQPVKPNDYAKEFLGWYEKNQYGRYVKANLHKPIKNNNTHLYAKWVYEYLKLTYDLNLPSTDTVEGKTPIDTDSYIKDAKAQVKDVGEVKVNDGKKVFIGWSETQDGTSGLIKPSETVLMDKNKTLYAQWKEVYNPPLTKVTYNPNGGTGKEYSVENLIVEDFHKVLDNDKDENLKYSREGYVFKGWSRDKAATKAELQAGKEVNVNQLEEDKNNYIYAIWAPIINYTTDGNGQVKKGENFVDNTKEEIELKTNPKGTETKAKEGYKFSHWTADKEITLNDGTKIPAGGKITEEQLKQAVITEPLTFKANFVQYKFIVKHEFVSSTEGKELPKAVTDLTPAQQTGKKDGETVTPTAPTQTEVKDTENDGTWTFKGFKDQNPDTPDKVDAKVNGADVTFEGSWEFTPNKHEVIHKFVSKDPKKELPKEVTELIPANQTGKVKGNEVTPTEPKTKTVKVKDGTWNFVSYDKNKETVDNKDVEFTGTWEFTPEYKVEHKFVSSTEGKELPKAVTDLTPAQQTGKKDGETVTPTAPTQTEVKDTENDGTWTFKGFKDQNPDTPDKVDAKVNGADVTFEGSWEFTANKHEVIHKFVSKDPKKELPKEVTELIPANQTGKVKGNEVTPTEPKTKTVKVKDGTWNFVSYDKNKETVDNKDVEFTGTWEFTPEYKVTHEFKVAKDSPVKEMPADVKTAIDSQLPDEKTAENGTNAKPGERKNPTEVKDATNDGTWTFEGFKDQNPDTKDVDAKVNGADVTFEGSWKFTPNKHKVTYEYVSGTKGVDLPEALKAKAPKEVTDKVKGDKVKSPVPTGDDATFKDDVNKGTWTFKSFDKSDVTIFNQDEKVTGTWEFTPEYTVKHEFKVAEDSPVKEMPADVKKAVDAQLPDDKTAENGTNAKPGERKNPTEVKDATNDGTWTFEGFKDQNPDTKDVDAKVNGADVTFEGSWKFTPNKHEVIHKFVSKDPKKELPKEVTELIPANQTGKVKGNEVTPTQPTKTTVKVKDGTWKFVGYDQDSKTVDKGNVEFTGTWEFTPEYTVKHEFKVAEDSPVKEMPADVKKAVDAQLPDDKTAENGTNAKPGERKNPTEVKDATNDGTWTFEGFKDQNPDTPDKVDAKVNGADVTFEGSWKFTPNKHKVTYKFVSEDSTKPLPDEVKNLLPDTEKDKVKGDKVTPTKPIPESITTRDGVWTFVKYDKDSETVDNKDLEFTGTWKFTPKPDPVFYKVNHQFKSATKGKDLPQAVKDQLPDQQTGIEDKSTVKPTAPKQTDVVDTENDGIWKFKGYKDLDITTDEVDAKVDGADVMFEGRWEFTPNKHKVTYEYVSGTEGVELPAELKAKAPKEVTGKVKGDTVTSPVLEEKDAEFRDDVNKGTWKFKSFDKGDVTISNQDEKVTGTWEFTPDPVTEFVDQDGNTIATKENGKQPKKDIEGYEFVKTETDDKGNTKHIYKKKTTPPTTEVVTEYIDENGNTISPKENGKQTNKDIDGYEFVRTETDDKGNTKHIYKKKTTTPTEIVTEFVDEDGNAIAPKENGTKDKIDIDGYEFVKTETDDKGNTKHIYKKKTTTPTEIVTEFVDEEGNSISPKENGKQTNKDIDGYEFVRTETDDKGNTKHIYKKKTTPPTTEVVTEYVDEEGNTISPKENGKQTNKDIDGYEFVKTETDDKGNTKHIYKKKTTPPTTEVVTEYIDENGNAIAPKENGTKDKIDIDGYEFVKTETDDNGNTKHIYKKKTTTPTEIVTKFVDENGVEISVTLLGKNPSKAILGYELIRTETDSNGNIIYVYKKKAAENQNINKSVDRNGNKISKSTKNDNPQTGTTDSDDVLILLLMGSAIALHKIRKYR